MMGQQTCSESLFYYFRIEDHIPDDHLLRVVELSQTPEFAIARRARNKIEALFSEVRNQIRLRKLRLRGLRNAKEQFILAATAQNLKRLVKFLNQPKHTVIEMA